MQTFIGSPVQVTRDEINRLKDARAKHAELELARACAAEARCATGCEVYFVDGRGGIKIGYSSYPMARIRDLQAGNPRILELLGTMPGDHRVETPIHDMFWRDRIHREWFRDTKRLRAFIGKHCHPANDNAPPTRSPVATPA